AVSVVCWLWFVGVCVCVCVYTHGGVCEEEEGAVSSSDISSNCVCVCVCLTVCVHPHQSAQQVHGLQYELLVSDAGHAQVLQLLVCDPEQLLAANLLMLK